MLGEMIAIPNKLLMFLTWIFWGKLVCDGASSPKTGIESSFIECIDDLPCLYTVPTLQAT